MNKQLRKSVILSGLLLVGLVAGCGPRYKLIPAQGILKIDGQPAAEINVMFMPDSVGEGKGFGPTSYGMTDQSGRFVLRTTDGREGAVVGRHRVILSDTTIEQLSQEREEELKRQRKWPPQQRLDDRYGTIAAGVTAEVKEGGGEITIDIPAFLANKQ
jgi:hypothetical protein